MRRRLLRCMSPFLALKRPASHFQQCLQLGAKRTTFAQSEFFSL